MKILFTQTTDPTFSFFKTASVSQSSRAAEQSTDNKDKMHNPSLLHFRRRAPRAMKHIPPAIHRLCRRRASKRWSALLTQTRSRIGHFFGMVMAVGSAPVATSGRAFRSRAAWTTVRRRPAFVNKCLPHPFKG